VLGTNASLLLTDEIMAERYLDNISNALTRNMPMWK
jgi:hypothetical protein